MCCTYLDLDEEPERSVECNANQRRISNRSRYKGEEDEEEENWIADENEHLERNDWGIYALRKVLLYHAVSTSPP
jgi:hypothetical protein